VVFIDGSGNIRQRFHVLHFLQQFKERRKNCDFQSQLLQASLNESTKLNSLIIGEMNQPLADVVSFFK